MGVVFSFICAFGVLFRLTGCNESTGAMWYSGTDVPTYTTYPAKVGDFYLDEDDFIVYKYTQNDGWQVIGSLKGQDGLTPTISINTEGYWVINGETTNVKAEGQDGSTPTVTINNDGYWVINGEVTDVKAQGEEGQKGEDGKDGTSFLSGEGVPASTLGNDGDVYLNITTSDFIRALNGSIITENQQKKTLLFDRNDIIRLHQLYFDKIIQYLNDKEVEVILLNTPKYVDIIGFDEFMQEEYPGIRYLNYSACQWDKKFFKDVDHLNVVGAKKFTGLLKESLLLE